MLAKLLHAILWLSVPVLLICAVAHARNLDGRYDDAPYHKWYEQQFNANGGWCCNKADGHPYDGEYTIDPDGGVTLKLKNGPHKIPKYMVLTGPNPTGHAVWWYVEGPDYHTDYCFAPGAGI